MPAADTSASRSKLLALTAARVAADARPMDAACDALETLLAPAPVPAR